MKIPSIKTIPEMSFSGKELKKFWRSIVREFRFDFSLQYPEKASLPLEEFADFYFRSDSLGSLPYSQKQRIAYNDAISSGIHDIFTPTAKGYGNVNEFFEDRKELMEQYAKKALFSKKVSEAYVKSGKSALEAFVDFEKYWDRKFDGISEDDRDGGRKILNHIKKFINS